MKYTAQTWKRIRPVAFGCDRFRRDDDERRTMLMLALGAAVEGRHRHV